MTQKGKIKSIYTILISLLILISIAISYIIFLKIENQPVQISKNDRLSNEPVIFEAEDEPATETKQIVSQPETFISDEIDTELDFISSEIFEDIDEEFNKATFKKEYGDLKNYICLDAMPYKITQEIVKQEQLPQLYEMLKDKQYAKHWHNIARIIGYISDDPNSVSILLDYFQQDDVWNLDTNTKFVGKIWSLASIGFVGGEEANQILKKCSSSIGAKEFAKKWIDEDVVPNNGRWKNKEYIINKIRATAVLGLAYSANTENTSFIKNLYDEEYIDCKESKTKTEFFYGLIDAMATQEFILQNSKEFYKGLHYEELVEKIEPFINKYNKSLK